MSQPIVIVGLRCVGKSSVGRALAGALKLPFVDLDEELAARSGSGQSVGELLEELGEPAFRELEAAALEDCMTRGPLVLATGGGVVEREENCTRLRSGARVIWLDASSEALLERRERDDTARPLLSGGDPREELSVLGPRRRPLYESLAGAPVDTTTREVEAIADELAEGLRNEIDSGD